MRVIVCGDRRWNNRQCIEDVFREFVPPGSLIIHGAARGADVLAAIVARDMGMRTWAFPAEWGKLGNAAGPIRNQRMLKEGKPELVIAFHENVKESKGTKHMLEIASKAGINCMLFTGKEK